MIIDTHTHIFLNKQNLEVDIIDGLKKDWIDKIISIWTDLDNSLKCIELSRENPRIIYATIWIHPTDIWQYKDDLRWAINKLENMLLENMAYVKWIWECWFDYHWIDKNNFEEEKARQEDFFRAQIELAKKYSLPIIVHTRDAKEDTLRVIKETWCKKFVLHCYSEDLDFALRALYYSDECMISFSGIVTYKSAPNVQKTAANIPLEKILVETDCPFLSPQPVRWQENIPNYTRFNLEKVFELRKENGKKESFEEVEKQIYENSTKFFLI